MKKIRLANALKIKNRLAGEVKRLQEIIARENSRSEYSTSNVDVALLTQKLSDTTENLIQIKTELAKANTQIYEKIERMSELKSKITFFKMIDTKDGLYSEHRSETKIKFIATHKREDVDKIVKDMQTQIENLQDEIDEYNATSFIEVNS